MRKDKSILAGWGKNKLLFWLVLLLAIVLRVYRLNNLELFGDEIDVGYQAYSLWTTGRDYLGNKLPFYLHSFSEWRAPLLMYLTAPLVGLFGLSVWTVRLPPVFFGVVSIFLLYLLVKKVSKDENLALLTALVCAISPWQIHYSRTAFEATLLLALVLLGTLLFLHKRWFLAALSFALSFYAYNIANIFVPLWLGVLLALNFKKMKNNLRELLPAVGVFLVVLPLLVAIVGGRGSGRFQLINIFNNPETVDRIVFRRTTGLEDRKVERIFHNKVTGWGKEFISNYMIAFSPQFLFLKGDPNPRHNSPGSGQFFWLMAPLFLVGLRQMVREKNKNLQKLTFAWLILAPIASSLTIGGGNQATRLFLMTVPMSILIALGMKKIFSSSILKVLILSGLAISLVFWWHNLVVHYPKEEYRSWHYGYREAMTWLRENEDRFNRVIINNHHEPALGRYLFWTAKNPSWLQDQFTGDIEKENIIDGFNGFLVDQTYFGGIAQLDKLSWLTSSLDKDSVYLAFQLDEAPGDWDWGKEPPEGLKTLKTVYDPWGKPLMYWLTKK